MNPCLKIKNKKNWGCSSVVKCPGFNPQYQNRKEGREEGGGEGGREEKKNRNFGLLQITFTYFSFC